MAVRLRTGSMHRISYLPSPMAAQVISVIMTREQLWQRWALGFLCLRSQHRVSRYSSSPSSERISRAAGMEASMPRLWKRQREREKKMISKWLSITDWFLFVNLTFLNCAFDKFYAIDNISITVWLIFAQEINNRIFVSCAYDVFGAIDNI